MQKQTDNPKIKLEEAEFTELILTDQIIPLEYGRLCSPKEWAFEFIPVGATAEFKIRSVDERFIKLFGTVKSVDDQMVVFENLTGLIYVKGKFQKGISVIVDYGNRIYVSTVIQLKNQLLILKNPPLKVLQRGDKRTDQRFPCEISVLLQVEQRGVATERPAVVKNLSFGGCCLAIERTKDGVTGFSVGKEITVILELKSRNMRISIFGTIRNVRKDNASENIRLAGIEFRNLSQEASETIRAIINRLSPAT
jgi:hypothetical protein